MTTSNAPHPETQGAQRARRVHGFSLIEVMLAAVIGALVIAAASQALVLILRHTKRMDQQAHADEETKLLLDHLIGIVQQVSGGQIRPHHGFIIENNCAATTMAGISLPACDGSDRIHVLTLDDSIPAVTLNDHGFNGVVAKSEPGCAFGLYEHKTFVVVNTAGTALRSAYCKNATSSNGTCQCTTEGAPGFSTPNANGIDYGGATAAVGTVATFYVNRTTKTLRMVTDIDNDGDADDIELADHVWDMQAQYGLDVNGDQAVDTWTSTYGSAAPSTLRMARIGLVIGVPVPSRDAPATATALDGPARNASRGVYLRSASARAVLRNLDLFL